MRDTVKRQVNDSETGLPCKVARVSQYRDCPGRLKCLRPLDIYPDTSPLT